MFGCCLVLGGAIWCWLVLVGTSVKMLIMWCALCGAVGVGLVLFGVVWCWFGGVWCWFGVDWCWFGWCWLVLVGGDLCRFGVCCLVLFGVIWYWLVLLGSFGCCWQVKCSPNVFGCISLIVLYYSTALESKYHMIILHIHGHGAAMVYFYFVFVFVFVDSTPHHHTVIITTFECHGMEVGLWGKALCHDVASQQG